MNCIHFYHDIVAEKTGPPHINLCRCHYAKVVTIARVFCCFPTDKYFYWNRSLSAVSCTAEATRVAQEEKVPREQEPMQAAGGAVTL